MYASAQKDQSQISLPKHKSLSQNTNHFPKTKISFPKHKSISQNTNQFPKTQISLTKHKPVCQNTNQFLKTQTNSAKPKSKDWALALQLSEREPGRDSFPCGRQLTEPSVIKCFAAIAVE